MSAQRQTILFKHPAGFLILASGKLSHPLETRHDSLPSHRFEFIIHNHPSIPRYIASALQKATTTLEMSNPIPAVLSRRNYTASPRTVFLETIADYSEIKTNHANKEYGRDAAYLATKKDVNVVTAAIQSIK
jgi:hypothetical protein